MIVHNKSKKPIILTDRITARTWGIPAGGNIEAPPSVAMRLVARGAIVEGGKAEKVDKVEYKKESKRWGEIASDTE
jgi:hypothetical protein